MPNKSNKTPNAMSKLFGDFANVVARAAGKPAAFVIAAAIIVIWAATGPVFQYSDTWQLIINTGTTIVTFLMVSSFRTRKIGIVRRYRLNSMN